MPNIRDADTATNSELTTHATKRMQQRGVSREQCSTVFKHGDIEVPAGNGCFRLEISYGRLRWLVRQGAVPAQTAEKCSRLVVITNGGTVVTAYRRKR